MKSIRFLILLNSVFTDVTLVDRYKCFGGKFCFHLQVRRLSRVWNCINPDPQSWYSFPIPELFSSTVELLFCIEDGNTLFLETLVNIWLHGVSLPGRIFEFLNGSSCRNFDCVMRLRKCPENALLFRPALCIRSQGIILKPACAMVHDSCARLHVTGQHEFNSRCPVVLSYISWLNLSQRRLDCV